jgi:hypothetical protein
MQNWPVLNTNACSAVCIAASRSASAKQRPLDPAREPVDDVRALAAQLNRDLLQGVARQSGHVTPGLGRAGERDLVDPGMADERLARRTVSGEDVDHPVRDACLLEDLREAKRRQRRLLGGFVHDGVARGQGRRELGG